MTLQIGITIFVFIATMLVIFWRPKGINEAYPAAVGAGIIFLTGGVSKANIVDIIDKIGGASITIIATIVMAVILESFGFFHWSACQTCTFSQRFRIPPLLVYPTALLFNDPSI